ncbi:cyclase family protein [Agrobacterium larrymoorei]|uniref:Cyclase family protein n=1 Tax=Agrobacterium larrymoorei TaxID=160699 RepID=A0AAF0KEW9_9HYPH|nr:cyclase family protein [Agrobacterium larrymoorei]WHA42613.1 cyclase family protein [Agrobacterium larrymoorei]
MCNGMGLKYIPPHMRELLSEMPTNWGKWGPDDEVGALNYLTPEEVLRGKAAISSGKTFTLQIPIGHPHGDPMWPGRRQAHRMNLMDKGHFLCGYGPEAPGSHEYADDLIIMYLQGSTQYDALGHVWYGDQIYNGYDARSTVGAMRKASILPIAEKAIAGHGVLIDMARHRNKPVLERGETFDHTDLMAAAAAQNITISKRDILLIHTGWVGSFYEKDPDEFYKDYLEPGLTFSPDLVNWFKDMEIPNLVTDTLANEVTYHPESGVMFPLHCALMRNLGIAFTEVAALDELANDCAQDGQYGFFYTAAPLKVVGGTGAPVNPLVVK